MKYKGVSTLNSLRKLRKEKGLSQQNLAELLVVNQTAVSQWERGIATPSSRMLLKLSQIFNVSPCELLNDAGVTSPYQWDDSEIMEAVRESLPTQISGLNDALKACPAQEQKLTFDILVQLRYVLELKDTSKKMTALSMLHDVAAAVESLTGEKK